MDKDRFRELLQSFEQLSVKPEAGGQAEFDGDSPADETPEHGGARGSGAHHGEPAPFDVERFLAAVRENGTSFPELEATHPPPDAAAFQPNEALASIAAEGAEMRVQQQFHTAARFRFMAGLAAQLWLQADGMARDRTATKGIRMGLASLKSNLVAVCSANLVEAGQMEAQAQAQTQTTDATSLTLHAGAGSPDAAAPAADQPAGCAKPCALALEIALGARISEFANAWPAVSMDPWVLQTVAKGLRFDFSADPEHVDAPEPEYSAEESAAIEKVIRWDLGDRVIEEIPYRPDLFVSHMYTLRIAGRLKALVEFRQLNKFLEAGNVAVEEAPALSSLLRKHDWVTRVNIKCAYPSVPISPEHRRFLVFRYEDRYYQYRALPFGISVASRVFTRLLQTALRPLRAEGFCVTSHIDEICLMHESYARLTEQTKRLCRHLVDLGFLINTSTSDLVPQQNQRFLGFVFNTVDGVVHFPKDQIKKVRRAAHTARSAPITAKQLASLLGKIRSLMPAVGPEPWRIREMERCLEGAITSPESWDDPVQLSASALDEIGWLCDSILVQKSMPLTAPAATNGKHDVAPDAS